MYTKQFTISGRNADSLFTSEKGFGTWDPSMAETIQKTASEESLKSGGWNRRVFEESIAFPEREVLIIKADVPSFGTYKLKLRVSAETDLQDMMFFAGRRNLIDRSVTVKGGSVYEKEFYTAVTPYIPALSSERCNDKAVFISLLAGGLFEKADTDKEPVLNKTVTVDIIIEEKEVPVIWIAGDSTLTDQNTGMPYFPKDSCGGWAQMLPEYIKDAAVCNMAHSGLTTNCFRVDGHYDIVREFIKAGDIFIMQFGHNDQKRRNLKAFKGYSDNLRTYVKEIRDMGAEAIICSPISRIPLSIDKKLSKELGVAINYSLLSSYAEAAGKVAAELEVPFADLHGRTFDTWVELGEAGKDYFIKGDSTHTNDFGAILIAGYFMDEIRKLQYNPLSEYDNGKNTTFGGIVDYIEAPKEVIAENAPCIELPYVDIPKIKDCIFINEALKYGILDPCIMHLHPDDEMPRGQFLMTMLKAFRLGPTRPYRKYYADMAVDEWDSGFVQTLIDENLIDDITIQKIGDKKLFRPDDALTYGEYASFIVRFMEKDKDKRNISMEDCIKKAYELNIIGDICKDNENDFEFYYEENDSEDYKIAGCPYISRAKAYRGLARMIDVVGGIGTALPADMEIHPAR
jgi:lysophospholipase L1-like esterase